MNAKKLLCGLLPILLAPVCVFGASATDLMRRAQDADKYVSYRGFKIATVHFAGGMTHASLKVVHLKPDETRTEYYTPNALAGIILIQEGEELWKFSPADDSWRRLRSSNLSGPEDQICCVFENYELRVIGTDTVAQRPAFVVHAVPRHSGETARRIWVDKEFYLVVRTQVESPRGSIIDSSKFTSIKFNPGNISHSSFKINGKVKKCPQPSKVKFRTMVPSHLPKGYKLIGKTSICAGGHSCVHLQFSNGINTISLFQRKADIETTPVRVNCRVTNVLTWAHAGRVFTLVGDVPKNELRKIAYSVR